MITFEEVKNENLNLPNDSQGFFYSQSFKDWKNITVSFIVKRKDYMSIKLLGKNQKGM